MIKICLNTERNLNVIIICFLKIKIKKCNNFIQMSIDIKYSKNILEKIYNVYTILIFIWMVIK